MPLIFEATFMPLRGVIILDGLAIPYNVLVGAHETKVKGVYMNAKRAVGFTSRSEKAV